MFYVKDLAITVCGRVGEPIFVPIHPFGHVTISNQGLRWRTVLDRKARYKRTVSELHEYLVDNASKEEKFHPTFDATVRHGMITQSCYGDWLLVDATIEIRLEHFDNGRMG